MWQDARFYRDDGRLTRGRQSIEETALGTRQSGWSRTIRDLRVVSAMRLVEAQLDKPMTTASLAEAVGLSRFYFIRLFQDHVGETTMDYIRRIRLERSAVSLITSLDPIVDIGLSVGYGSQSAFTRAFTQRFDISPAEYRRNIAQNAILSRRSIIPDNQLANFRIGVMADGHYVARRYLGADARLSLIWDEYLNDVRSSALAHGDPYRYEVAYDDPRITEPEHMRVDLCLRAPVGSSQMRDWHEKGFQRIDFPLNTYAILDMPRHRRISDRDVAVLLDAWFNRQKRYRRSTGFAMMKCWFGCNDASSDQPDRILVPLDLA